MFQVVCIFALVVEGVEDLLEFVFFFSTLFGVIIGTIPNKKNAFWGPFFAHIFRHYQGKIKAI